jgi:ADP-heptose:LPS heptosyltransferase
MSNVLIFRIGSLGDTLIALPAFHLLRAQFKNSCITLLTNSSIDGGVKAAPSYQILIGSGLIDKYIEYPPGQFNIKSYLDLLDTIRQLKPVETIYLMPCRTIFQRMRDALFLFSAGVWKIRGLLPGINFNLHRKIDGMSRYESEASRLLRTVGFSPRLLSQPLFSLMLQQNERDTAQKVIAQLNVKNHIIALSIGAKVPAKDWGNNNWIELLTELSADFGRYSLIFLGSQDEYERCLSLSMNWPGEIINLCGQMSPRQSAAILEHAAVFVGHDSGPLHLASSVGIPCVAIFAARDRPGVWFPYGNEENVFYNNVQCSNCRLSVCEERKMICIKSISPSEVANRIKNILSIKKM